MIVKNIGYSNLFLHGQLLVPQASIDLTDISDLLYSYIKELEEKKIVEIEGEEMILTNLV